MISLKEALVRKNRSVNIDDLTMQKIWEYLNKNYTFSEDSRHYVKADKLKSKIEITPEGVVNAPGLSIKCVATSITSLTDGEFKFGKCSTFDCRERYSLKSLKGAPTEITHYLFCQDCINLESIDEDITIQREPREIFIPGAYFDGCKKLKSLKGLHIPICDYFSVEGCENLLDLQGGPTTYCVKLNCNGCIKLKSLKGAPYEVREKMICTNCSSLKQFKDIENNKIEKIEIDENIYNKFTTGKIKCPNNYKFSSWTYPKSYFYLYYKK